jgi:hypothetical protein
VRTIVKLNLKISICYDNSGHPVSPTLISHADFISQAIVTATADPPTINAVSEGRDGPR